MYHNKQQRDFARQLRNKPTPAEKRLWHFLQASKLGVKFRRQAAIGVYIVDFVCFSHRLVVELDGPQHLDDAAIEYDRQRSAWLRSRGFRVIRFRNQELDENIWSVVEEIKCALDDMEEAAKLPPPQPSPQGWGWQKC